MSRIAKIALILLGFGGHVCTGAEIGYSLEFLETYGTNYTRRDFVKPSLLDTNNTAPKLLSALSVRQAKNFGEMGSVRLGMKMNDVVARWGKPPKAWAYCARGPRFRYEDVAIDFENGIVCRIGPVNPKFEGGLSRASNRQAWMRAFGEPTHEWRDGSIHLLSYSTNHITTQFCFDRQSDEFVWFNLRLQPKPPARKENDN